MSVVLVGATASLVDRVLAIGDGEFVEDQLLRIGAQLVSDRLGVREDVSQRFLDAITIKVFAPLEALQQFASFDGDAPGKVRLGVELRPIPLCREVTEVSKDEFATHVRRVSSRNSPAADAIRQPPPVFGTREAGRD